MPIALRILFSLAAVAMATSGTQGLRRGEILLRRRWGEIGPKELGTLHGARAKVWSVWLLIAAVGFLVVIWRS